MNKVSLLIIVLFCYLVLTLSCEKDSTSIILIQKNDTTSEDEIISLDVGNEYMFRASSGDSVYFVDWFFNRN